MIFDLQKVGEMIAAKREQAGLSQEELAQQSGLPVRVIRDLEQFGLDLCHSEWMALNAALGCCLNQVMHRCISFPQTAPAVRQECVNQDVCPDCGHALDKMAMCGHCGFDGLDDPIELPTLQ